MYFCFVALQPCLCYNIAKQTFLQIPKYHEAPDMINNKHKDRLFSYIFGREENKKWTLSLYNAVNHSFYTNPEDIQITTMSDVLYMGMKNDISFILANIVSIYEQQSTFNPNMPLREFMYAARLYDKYIHDHELNIYGTELISLPVPKLMVFYNGTNEMDNMLLELKDAFEPGAEPDIAVKVRMLNINYGRNRKLMESCRPLFEYSWLIDRIREHKKEIQIEEAVDRALNEMPWEFEIRQFLLGNRAEVLQMCITEYNEAETMRMFKAEGRKEGHREGRREGRKEGIQGAVDILRTLGNDDEKILLLVMKEYQLSEEDARNYL